MNGTEMSLEFGGHGRFFKNVSSGIFFKLDPENKYKALNRLIDRIEKMDTK